MWRDRTNLYISYRQSYAHHPAKRTRYGSGRTGAGFSDGFSVGGAGDEDRRGLLSAGAFDDHRTGGLDPADADDGGDAVIEMDVLPPRWADVSDEVNETLTRVAHQSAQLERLHQRHVLPGFNDDSDTGASARRADEGEIERLTQAITKGFHDCHRSIQRMEALVREQRAQGTLSKAEEVIAKNLQISLAGRVQDASARFRSKQSAYLKKLRGMGGFASPADRASTPLAGTSTAITYSTDPSLLESDADKTYSESTLSAMSGRGGQSRQQQLRAGVNDAVIAQREREIEEIAQGIIDLADLFRDLQTMVIDQGTMLDRIDYNVERMTTDVKEAEKELAVAEGYQKKTTKRKIIFLLLLVVIGMVILLIIKPKRHGGGGGGGGRGGSGDMAGGGDPMDSNPGGIDNE